MRKDLKSNEIQEVTQIQESADMHKKTKRSRKIYAIIASVLAVVLLIGGTFAYFTDYATLQTSGTAGTVKIAVDDNINLLNEDGYDILNPGDQRDVNFTVTNEGNKSVDASVVILLDVTDKDGNPITLTGDSETQSEYDIYLRDDVELLEGRGYAPKEGAKPVQIKYIDGGFMMYELPTLQLNGNSDLHDEVETIDGVNEFSHTYDFVLVFKGEAGNEFQASKINLEVLVDAIQHENTGGSFEATMDGTTLELAKRTTGCPYYYSDSISSPLPKCTHDIPENTCRGKVCDCVHVHSAYVTNANSKYTFILCEDIETVHVEGNVIWYPLEYSVNGDHLHKEITVGNYTHIYCEYVDAVCSDGLKAFYPWSLYEGGGTDFTGKTCEVYGGYVVDHKHVEKQVGSKTHIYCESVESQYTDGDTVWYPHYMLY